jgi:hypothetical protein
MKCFQGFRNQNRAIRDRCYDFFLISPKNLAKILAIFVQTTASFFSKKMITTLVFEKNANFCRRQLAKIAEYTKNRPIGIGTNRRK